MIEIGFVVLLAVVGVVGFVKHRREMKDLDTLVRTVDELTARRKSR